MPKNEIKRLSALFVDLDETRKSLVKKLIEQAAFMSVTLQKLQDDIAENGAVMPYDNGGGQTGVRKNPSAELYTVMSKNYAAIIKQLESLLPKPEAVVIDDGFEAFVNSRG